MVTRRRLRTELRRLREEKSFAQDVVANEMEWSISKLIRIENGSVGISVNDLKALLDLYDLDESGRDELIELARASRQRMWWSRYQKHLSATYLEFIGYEADATSIRHFQPLVVPGLLQTEAYARAINAGTSLSLEPRDGDEERIEVRLERQRDIFERPNPAEYIAVIDEAVLHRPVGGAETMRAQLAHLVEMARRPRVSVYVVPYAAGAHPGLIGAFSIMEFADPVDDDVLHLDSAPNEAILRDQPEAVERYRRVFERLIALSLRGDAVEALIRSL
jgi:transcriptional regulator with XRE-family HTH domain